MPPSLVTMDPCQSAESLRRVLEEYGIASDVHDGYGLALVSVWVNLVVWSDGSNYWWRTGWSTERGRFTYAWHTALEPGRAARRIAFRYAELRRTHPLPVLMTGAPGDPV